MLLRDTRGGRQVLSLIASRPQYFSGTVLYEYASRINASDPDPQWAILAKAARSYVHRRKLVPPQCDELVVHLRMGDIKGYKGDPETVADYIADIVHRRKNLARITLVTALHFGALILKNQYSPEDLEIAVDEETTKVKNIISRLDRVGGVPIGLRSNAEIDRDFCYLANASYLVLGNGLFSLCAARISSAQLFVPPWIRTGSHVGNRLLETEIRPRGPSE